MASSPVNVQERLSKRWSVLLEHAQSGHKRDVHPILLVSEGAGWSQQDESVAAKEKLLQCLGAFAAMQERISRSPHMSGNPVLLELMRDNRLKDLTSISSIESMCALLRKQIQNVTEKTHWQCDKVLARCAELRQLLERSPQLDDVAALPTPLADAVEVLSQEQALIVSCPHSVFVQGRSGTGKTLILLRRMLFERRAQMTTQCQRDMLWNFLVSNSDDVSCSAYCTLFACLPGVQLTPEEVAEDFNDFLKSKNKSSTEGLNKEEFFELLDAHSAYMGHFDLQRAILCMSMSSMPLDMCISATTLENHLPMTSFKLFVTRSSLLRDHVLSKLESRVQDTCTYADYLKGRCQAGMACLTWVELIDNLRHHSCTPDLKLASVDYDGFVDFLNRCAKQVQHRLQPSTIWTEINTRLRSFDVGRRGLCLEEYQAYETSATGLPLAQAEKALIYNVFQQYSRWKEHKGLLDDADVAHMVFDMLQSGQFYDVLVDEIYIDEAQDFSPAELMALMSLCRDPDGLTMAGDTCQTVNPGSAFCFKDIALAFRDFWARTSAKNGDLARAHETHLLRVNYRSSSGVAVIANSIAELLLQRFPHSVDRIDGEIVPDLGGALPLVVTLPGATVGDYIMGTEHHRLSRSLDPIRMVVLVYSDAERRALRRQGVSATILTVLESKGLEFDICILCNLLSEGHHHKITWRLVDEESQESKFLIQHNLGEGQCFSPEQRQLLGTVAPAVTEMKVVYVALTRARTGVVFLECSSKLEVCAPLLSHWQKEGLADVWQGHQKYTQQTLLACTAEPQATSASSQAGMTAKIRSPNYHLSGYTREQTLDLIHHRLEKGVDRLAFNMLNQERRRLQHGGNPDPEFLKRFEKTCGLKIRIACQSSDTTGAAIPSIVPLIEHRYCKTSTENVPTSTRERIDHLELCAMRLFTHAADKEKERFALFEEARRILVDALALTDVLLSEQATKNSNAARQKNEVIGLDASARIAIAGLSIGLFQKPSWRGYSTCWKLRNRHQVLVAIFRFLAPQDEHKDAWSTVAFCAELAFEHMELRKRLGHQLILAGARHSRAQLMYDVEESRQQKTLQERMTQSWHSMTSMRSHNAQKRAMRNFARDFHELKAFIEEAASRCASAAKRCSAVQEFQFAAEMYALAASASKAENVWPLAAAPPHDLLRGIGDISERQIRLSKQSACLWLLAAQEDNCKVDALRMAKNQFLQAGLREEAFCCVLQLIRITASADWNTLPPHYEQGGKIPVTMPSSVIGDQGHMPNIVFRWSKMILAYWSLDALDVLEQMRVSTSADGAMLPPHD